VRDLERRHGGRLGVAVRDIVTGRSFAHRGDERFAMCSTFKLITAALVLARVDQAKDHLDRRVRIKQLVTYSPVTEKHAGGDLTVAELCEAALTLSDNTAANLLLESFGGPPAWTAFARSLGDQFSRLDRWETALNEASPNDPRDTTTPAAMLASMRKVLLGDVLSPRSRAQMIAWLRANKTGDQRLRAKLPPGWIVGDKTGSGENAATNDIAIVWPEPSRPMLVTAYYAESRAPMEERNAVLAELGKLLIAMQ
jgi:beta-lactamase class A